MLHLSLLGCHISRKYSVLQRKSVAMVESILSLPFHTEATGNLRVGRRKVELSSTLKPSCNGFEKGTMTNVLRSSYGGQSIGAGVASVGLANLLNSGTGSLQPFCGLILETPFVDLKAMLLALYPQKFLPYRYLAPFLWSTWDSKTALRKIGQSNQNLKVLMLEAGNDEIVPSGQAEILERVCREMHLEVERRTVAGALHTEVMVKGQGRSLIAKFVQSF